MFGFSNKLIIIQAVILFLFGISPTETVCLFVIILLLQFIGGFLRVAYIEDDFGYQFKLLLSKIMAMVIAFVLSFLVFLYDSPNKLASLFLYFVTYNFFYGFISEYYNIKERKRLIAESNQTTLPE